MLIAKRVCCSDENIEEWHLWTVRVWLEQVVKRFHLDDCRLQHRYVNHIGLLFAQIGQNRADVSQILYYVSRQFDGEVAVVFEIRVFLLLPHQIVGLQELEILYNSILEQQVSVPINVVVEYRSLVRHQRDLNRQWERLRVVFERWELVRRLCAIFVTSLVRVHLHFELRVLVVAVFDLHSYHRVKLLSGLLNSRREYSSERPDEREHEALLDDCVQCR